MTAKMKIFLDVGAHIGETLAEVTKPSYRFDVIHAFEPQDAPHAKLVNRFAGVKNCRLHNFGLAESDCKRTLYGVGMSASMFADKSDIDNQSQAECNFRMAYSFVEENVGKDDFCVMKLNCEGGEVAILRNLIATDAILRIDYLMVDFNVRKIPSQAHEEIKVTQELQNCGASFTTPKQSMIGITHEDRIRFWLSNLPSAPEFMQLTSSEIKRRYLPFALRQSIARKQVRKFARERK